ncbi:hypothetical protein RRG08_028733 [Elysia crispata]|uniref:Uncharacterized protein n=1 Tax=Elysia crispata TaxID=231223 RepID=A0AAE1DJ87_9GAST|nr:hypothetical protein RRG08_028733 [Elysia crispata]
MLQGTSSGSLFFLYTGTRDGIGLQLEPLLLHLALITILSPRQMLESWENFSHIAPLSLKELIIEKIPRAGTSTISASCSVASSEKRGNRWT